MLYTHMRCLQMMYVVVHVCESDLVSVRRCVITSMITDSHVIRTCECIERQILLKIINRTCGHYTMVYHTTGSSGVCS